MLHCSRRRLWSQQLRCLLGLLRLLRGLALQGLLPCLLSGSGCQRLQAWSVGLL